MEFVEDLLKFFSVGFDGISILISGSVAMVLDGGDVAERVSVWVGAG